MGTFSSIIAEDIERIASTPLPWDRLRNKTILITGASGFLPAYMVETLLFLNATASLNSHVLGLVRDMDKATRRFKHYEGRSDLEIVEGDVSVGRTWERRCDIIIHAAGQASPKFFGSDPTGTMRASVLGTANLLEMARTWGSEDFLFFSSGEVYGQVSEDKIPTKETDYGYIEITNPRSCYAEGKRAAETLGMSFADQYNMPFKVVRPFHTYGPGMALDDGRVFADFTRDVVLSRDIVLRSTGEAIRAFCYLSDAVRGFFTVLLLGEQATAYNIGNPEQALSIRQLANVMTTLFPEKKLQVRCELHSFQEGYIPSSIPANIPNIDKATALGWRPVYSVRDGFLRTVQHYLNAL